MFRAILCTAVLVSVLGPAAASAQNTPIDVKAIPAEIKSLKWKDIDLDGLTPVERCRSLQFMNETLDEITARFTAEADLMSGFIDAKDLGPQFASQAPQVDPTALTFADGQKIAVALLRGPMAGSSYAGSFADASSDVLAAYSHLYQSTCQWKWGKMADLRLRVRSMAGFLRSQHKWEDYSAWAPGEVKRQQQEHAARLAQQEAAAAAAQQADQEKRLRQQQAMVQQEKQQVEQQQQQVQAASRMQQAMAAAQQSQAAPSGSPQVVGDDGYSDVYYGGLGAYGAAAWYRNNAYLGAAAARTDARLGAWHGARRRR